MKQFEEKISALEALCTAKNKEIAYLKENISAKDKEIIHLKEKVSELQHNGQKKEVDFAKQMETIDEELRKAKKNIVEAKESFVKKEVEVEQLNNQLPSFNAEDFFDLQPSWFDILPNNIGCLEIDNYPVRAKDLVANKDDGSSHKTANPKFSKTAEDFFDRQPSWFDTLPNNIGCLEIDNYPVRAKDLVANKDDGSSHKTANPKFFKAAEDFFDLQPSWFDTLPNNIGCLEIDNYPVRAKDLVANKGRWFFSQNCESKVLQGSYKKQGKQKGKLRTLAGIYSYAKSADSDNGYAQHRPLPFVPVSTVLDGSQMPQYINQAHHHNGVKPFPHEERGFLSRTFNKWFGY
ncbi:hypothetical protein OS493_013041 [Desmophyllum pertusum]|uniref:Uncharacterized protein n=1 Tax=Desmophyllum pertusum TaxID=174260 RepID=A0A9W9Z1W2_9CNID|nr:hypothetical protein OS493_013041 [Desmophyllum pertusum]